jgi:hypothetical protein
MDMNSPFVCNYLNSVPQATAVVIDGEESNRHSHLSLSNNPAIYENIIRVAADEGRTRSFLTSKGWCPGLQSLLYKNTRKIPLRIFICDDSGSMITSDGKRLHQTGNHFR